MAFICVIYFILKVNDPLNEGPQHQSHLENKARNHVWLDEMLQ